MNWYLPLKNIWQKSQGERRLRQQVKHSKARQETLEDELAELRATNRQLEEQVQTLESKCRVQQLEIEGLAAINSRDRERVAAETRNWNRRKHQEPDADF